MIAIMEFITPDFDTIEIKKMSAQSRKAPKYRMDSGELKNL